ncbi:MAG: hypothetical protein A2V98_16840 [Planctomycetes bacterium RBG_16_64_12]|nr:MAG: hypothetical protein A2V98_16840 [Planctomycetes bacterium RBG_16_64_12]
MILDKIFRLSSRLLAPKLAREMQRDGRLQLTDFSQEDIENFIEVDNRGSDVTIFSFAGLAVLFSGLPSYEFKRTLREKDYNLVFIRDIRRLCYHVTPDGQAGGLEFFEEHVKRVMASLGSSYHVAVGTSAGGSAAFYFGARCGMDQVIAFSPGYPMTVYCSFWHRTQTCCDVKRLITSPGAYFELLLVTVGAWWSYRRLCKTVGKDRIWPVIDTYRSCDPRPRATVFYSAGSRPDARQAALFDGIPEVKRVALPTLFHNCAGYLQQRGELGRTILGEVQAGIKEKALGNNSIRR